KLVEQHGARAFVEEVGDRCAGAKRLRVRAQHETPRYVQSRGLAAIRVLADERNPRSDTELRMNVRKANPQRIDGGDVWRHRHILRGDPMHKPSRRELRVLERVRLRITRIGRWWWGRLGRIIGRGLREDCFDVGAGLAMLLEPGVDLPLR